MRRIDLVLTLALFALLSSCTEEIPFDLNDEGFDRLVIEGFITDQQKSHEVRLTKTISYFDEEEVPSVSGATVRISNAADEWTLTETPVGSGRYYTPDDAAGTTGMTHRLTIEYDGQTFIAEDYMYPVAELEDVRVEYQEPEEDEEEGWWAVRIWTIETPDEKNFYRWRTLINGVTDGDTTRYSSFANDLGFDGAVLEDYIIEGYDEDDMSIGDTITLEQHAISEEYFDMTLAVLEQTEFQGGLFDPPPANVPTNLSGGALGFFAASSVSDQTTIIEE